MAVSAASAGRWGGICRGPEYNTGAGADELEILPDTLQPLRYTCRCVSARGCWQGPGV